MKNIIITLLTIFTCSVRLFSQEAGITNPADNLIIHRYNFDTYITETGDCIFDGWANPGNLYIKLYVNGGMKSFSCNNCGSWETTKTLDAGTNEIYIESKKDFDAYVASSHRTVTYMKPMTDGDFYLTDYPNDGKVKITWYKHSASGASGFYYRVYRNTTNQVETGADWVLLGNWTQDTYFEDNPPATGVTYYYWVVCASNNSGSNPSAFANSRNIVHEQPAPATPTNYTATSISSSEIQLNWSSSANATSYQIFTCAGSYIATETGNTYSVTDLTPDTYYEYKIKAVNLSGGSANTLCEGATTDLVVPLKPTAPTGDTLFYENSENKTYTTTGANYATSYMWELNPNESGIITGTGKTAIVDWNNNYSGSVSLTVAGKNSAGVGVSSEALLINIEAYSVKYNKIEFYNNVSPNNSNPNNYINTGVPIRFKVSVFNELSQNLVSTSGIISCSTTGVIIPDNSVNFNNINSNTEAWSTDEFEIQVDNTVLPGTVLEFELSVNDQIITGGPWISNFSFPVKPLVNGTIVLDDDSSPDSNGDNDNIPEPGETVELLPTLNNVSDFTMAEVKGTLTCEQSFINIWNAVNGANDYVYNNWKYNMISNVPTPIEPESSNVMPEFDFVFDYPSNNPLQELNFNLVVEGKLNDSNGTLMKWTTSTIYNEGIEAPPVVESLLPQDNAIDVLVESNFEITYDKDITAVVGKYIYIYESGAGVVSTIEATDAQVSVDNAIVTINPVNDLLGGKDYYIIIDDGAFTDNSGNDFAGINTTIEWNFTTKQNDPPGIPLNFTATAISESEIELTWDAVGLAEYYKIISCDESITYVASTAETSFLINSLTESTSYDFKIKAVNSIGSSGASTCVDATTFCNHPWSEAVVYTNSTVAYGIVTIEDIPASEHDMVGVFVDEECRGAEEVTINEGIAYVVINIQGEADDEIFNFKIWDASECSELNVNYTITSNPGGNIGYPPDYLPINAANCNDSNSPAADFIYTTDKLTTSFTNNSQNAETYLWDFGDGKTSTDENPVHVYESANNYEVKLTASNSLCGSNEFTQTINITTSIFNLDDEGFIKISPNPTNGIIFLETENIKSNQVLIEIININGQTVYKEIFTSQFLKEQIDLSEQPSGIYFVKIKADTFTKTIKLLRE